jgi:hypothetical protein
MSEREIIGDPLTGATCAACRFWVRNKPRPDLPGWENGGNCHHHPATLAKLSTSWCGDHAPRPEHVSQGEKSA